jgi:hypothetical protein
MSNAIKPAGRLVLTGTIALVSAVTMLLGFRPRQAAQPPGALSTQEVVRRMVATNAARRLDLRAFTAMIHYHLESEGLSHQTADMDVRLAYDGLAPKSYTIISESGSTMLQDHILKPFLSDERQEAVIDFRDGSALVPGNYAFTLVASPHADMNTSFKPGDEADPDNSYILALTPLKALSRFSFTGTLWINPRDFGVERLDGQPTKTNSWWVSRIDFNYQNRKFGKFWLPVNNHSVSQVRMFGHATLDITFSDYALTSIGPAALDGEDSLLRQTPQPGH